MLEVMVAVMEGDAVHGHRMNFAIVTALVLIVDGNELLEAAV